MSSALAPRAVLWLQDHPNAVSPYTRERILGSPEFVARMIEPCASMTFGHALDTGCGAGYDTFALADKFTSVLAMDTDRAAVRTAHEIARKAGVNNVEFTCTDAERLELNATADFLWCNGMSHNVHSRIRLFDTLVKALRPGGWLMYAEVTEGFAIKEIARAIDERDAGELRMRVRQVIAGLLNIPRFRFFLSGSAGRELSRLGLTISSQASDEWNGLPSFERVWGRLEAPVTGEYPVDAGDYTTEDADMQAVRSRVQAYLRQRKLGGFDPATQISNMVNETPNSRLAPLFLVLELAEMLPSTLSEKPSITSRIAARLSSRSIDWSRANAVYERLISVARERSDVNQSS
jgi:SAM-dependent methyltransferase